MMPKVEPPPCMEESQQLSLMPSHVPEAMATYPSHGPEEVLVLALIQRQDLAMSSHYFHLEYLVGSQSVPARKQRMAAAGQIPANGNGRASTANDHLPAGSRGLVQL
jgi:hypothetical protein